MSNQRLSTLVKIITVLMKPIVLLTILMLCETCGSARQTKLENVAHLLAKYARKYIIIMTMQLVYSTTITGNISWPTKKLRQRIGTL